VISQEPTSYTLHNERSAACSDVDFLVEFEPLGEMEYAPNYFSLLRSFDTVFGRQVDLLTETSIRNPYLRRAIDGEKVALYAA